MDTRPGAGYAASWTTEGTRGEKTVTEAEWLACTEPEKMLTFLRRKMSERKLRLYGYACYRRLWHVLRDERCRKVIEMGERFVDGLASREELHSAETESAFLVQEWQEAAVSPQNSLSEQAALLRDIFGNPFRPVILSPAVLAWNDGVVVRLAQTAYEERHLPAGTLDTARLAVLADAVEEAGVSDPLLLEHLRSPGPHVRGCVALDAVLGKS